MDPFFDPCVLSQDKIPEERRRKYQALFPKALFSTNGSEKAVFSNGGQNIPVYAKLQIYRHI